MSKSTSENASIVRTLLDLFLYRLVYLFQETKKRKKNETMEEKIKRGKENEIKKRDYRFMLHDSIFGGGM